jgi:hypothetical protein
MMAPRPNASSSSGLSSGTSAPPPVAPGPRTASSEKALGKRKAFVVEEIESEDDLFLPSDELVTAAEQAIELAATGDAIIDSHISFVDGLRTPNAPYVIRGRLIHGYSHSPFEEKTAFADPKPVKEGATGSSPKFTFVVGFEKTYTRPLKPERLSAIEKVLHPDSVKKNRSHAEFIRAAKQMIFIASWSVPPPNFNNYIINKLNSLVEIRVTSLSVYANTQQARATGDFKFL